MTRLKKISNQAILILTVLTLLAGCNMPARKDSGAPTPPAASGGNPPPQLPETLVSFRVAAPANTPPRTQVFLSILDEVTGLALNAQSIPMEDGGGAPVTEAGAAPAPVFVITLPFPIGAVIKYRYERTSESGVNVAEHLSDGSAVRYRMVQVGGQMLVDDVVSRWTDTPFTQPTGRISGKAVDLQTGAPIPSLLVTAGGAQTFTAADGSFLMEGLPPGVHNLVAYSPDGAYRSFQQGARVAAESTTPAELAMTAAEMATVVFHVRVPAGTLPVIPVRLAGNLYQLGNTFANLALGASVLPTQAPAMEALPDGTYKVTLKLPVGADIRYKYTLGDGYWNAERNADGTIRLRQLVVPAAATVIEDTVDTWEDLPGRNITFDMQAPPETPASDFVSIQFNTLIGWTEPLPMWNLGNGRWAYILYSPLTMPGDLEYRYCRNGQCAQAGDEQGIRKTPFSTEATNQVDQVKAWSSWRAAGQFQIGTTEAAARDEAFRAGVELLPSDHPSWQASFGPALNSIQAMKANLVVLRPTWSYGRMPPGNTLPLLSPQPERDASWFALTHIAGQVKAAGMGLALYPDANFLERWDQWWLSAPRQDPGWWPVWFDRYRAFVLHHADLATQSGAETLILGGDWLEPALPGGVLPDGQPSGVPDEAEQYWRSLLADVRSRFTGKLLWAMAPQALASPPVILDAFDGVYLTLTLPAGRGYADVLDMDLESWLDNTLLPFQYNTGLPLTLALGLPADPDLQTQVDLYERALGAVADRDWISGFVARGFYPAAALQDASYSVYGKPAAQSLAVWFGAWLGK